MKTWGPNETVDVDDMNANFAKTFRNEEAYDPDADYTKNDVVTDAGIKWVAKRPVSGVTPTVGDDWEVFSGNGGGGHVIVNPAGTSMTARGKLKLTGTAVTEVTDSAGTNETIVTIDGAVFHGFTAKTSTVNADELLIYDSVAGDYKKITKADFVGSISFDATKIWYGEGVPPDELGKDGDLYFNTTADDEDDFYAREDGTWNTIARVKGPKGDKGDKGDTGDDGIFSAIASQAEAQAGIETTKGMNSLRVKEAITYQAILKSIFTTKGDLLVATGSGVPVRLGVGANGKVLSPNSAQTTGLEWVDNTPADGTVTNAKVASGANIDAAKLGTGSVSNTEFGYLDGVTSAIQTQLNAKAPLASPALTGTPTAPTPTTGDDSTKIATTGYVQGELAGFTGGIITPEETTIGGIVVWADEEGGEAADSGFTIESLTSAFSIKFRAIFQEAHGLSLHDAVRVSGDNEYAAALGDTSSNAEVVGYVAEVVDVDNFKLGLPYTTVDLIGLTPATDYWLSDSVAGAYTDTEPTGSVKRKLFIAINETTALFVNDDVSGNGDSGGGADFIGAESYIFSAQTIPDSVATAIEFGGFTYDSSSFWDVDYNTRLTVPSDGVYRVDASISHASSGGGYRGISIVLNGDDDHPVKAEFGFAQSGEAFSLPISKNLELSAGDYVEVWVTWDGGGTAAADNSIFSVTKLARVVESGGGGGTDTTAYDVTNLPDATTSRNKVIYVSDGYESGPCGAISDGTNWLPFILGDAIIPPKTPSVTSIIGDQSHNSELIAEYPDSGTTNAGRKVWEQTDWQIWSNGALWALKHKTNPGIGHIARSLDSNPDDDNLPPTTGWYAYGGDGSGYEDVLPVIENN